MNESRTENIIATYYILDFDRTTFDTGKSTKVMEGVIALHNAELGMALAQRFEEAESLGESFSMRDFIVENVGEEETQKIEVKYKEAAAQQDLLMPGTNELVAYIESLPNTEFGILTYGSFLGQKMKLEASGLGHIPALITSETYKGALIASWRQADGLYHLPNELGGFVVKEIVLVDDKPFSFKGLPMDCRGYFVKSVYDAGMEMLPPYVAQPKTLKEVITAEKRHRA